MKKRWKESDKWMDQNNDEVKWCSGNMDEKTNYNSPFTWNISVQKFNKSFLGTLPKQRVVASNTFVDIHLCHITTFSVISKYSLLKNDILTLGSKCFVWTTFFNHSTTFALLIFAQVLTKSYVCAQQLLKFRFFLLSFIFQWLYFTTFLP